MTEDPRNPQDDETPDAGGDVAEPEASADQGEAPAEQPAVGEAQADAPAEAPAGEPAAEAEPPAEAEAPAEEPAAEAEAPAEAEQPAAEAEEPAAEAEPPVEAEAPAEESAAEAEPPVEAEAPAEEPAAEAEPPAEAEAPAEEPAAEAGAPAEGQAPDAEAAERRERPKPGAKGRKRDKDDAAEPDVVPGAHLEPDLVLESAQETPDEFGAYAQSYDASTTAEDDSVDTGAGDAPSATEEGAAEQPAAPTPRDLAADARYSATGKRKTAVARVILKPGDGTYTINGRTLDGFFPRRGLQRQARGPLETAGYESRMDVVAKIHGGGVSAQAGALRHGIARALVEADPNLRTELKRRGFLTRDARVKERKKAGLKKARKRPQFSKR